METSTGGPSLLKQANLTQVRRVILAAGTATRAEIARQTELSITTVRSLLSGMLRDGELETVGLDASSGGRKAERYAFCPNRYLCAALCMTDEEAYGLLVNICGDIISTTRLDPGDGTLEEAAVAFLDRLTAERELRSIGVGMPGVVDGGYFWRKNLGDDTLYRVELGDVLAKRYGIPIVMETDTKATAIGFGRCYQHEFPSENPEETNMAYLHFQWGCIGAGFIAGGRVLRGSNGFSGELGLIPMEDGRLLDECLADPMDDACYISRIARVLCWICGVLNPRYIALGGPDLRRHCMGPIGDALSALLPRRMVAELLYVEDMWRDYQMGMAHLAAAKIFDEVQIVKE